jgi:biopolymer transport protein TolR
MLKLRKTNESLMMSEINIIPFTDILLVVLIAFIVTTPLLVQSAIKVTLPKSELKSPVAKGKIVHVTITDAGKIYVNDKEQGNLDDFTATIESLNIPDKVVVVNSDEKINYGTVAKVLGILKAEGTTRLELAVDNK